MSPDALIAHVAARVARVVAPGDTLTLGLSGGRDSVVLLDLLTQVRGERPVDLHCVHVHHGLSPNADAWADFCAQLCSRLDVPLTLERVQLDRADARGVEAAARAARQAVFARQPGWVATAHHRDDQAETLLLQLLRGAGPKGLAAMPEQQTQPLASGTLRLLRPLLDVARDTLAAYARSRGLVWIDDESNHDTRYRRNALRHDILPAVTRHFPQAAATLARAASLQADAAALHDEIAEHDAAGEHDGVAIFDGVSLACAALGVFSPARARNLLRWFIQQRGGRAPQRAQLAEALTQLANPRADAHIALHLGDGTLARYRGRAHWLPPAPDWDGEWPGQALIDQAGDWLELGTSRVAVRAVSGTASALADTALCRAVLSRAVLASSILRRRRGGEIVQMHPGGPHRRLKNVLQESGIAPWTRDRLPLLAQGDRIVWAAGLGIAPEYRCQDGEPGWLIDYRDHGSALGSN